MPETWNLSLWRLARIDLLRQNAAVGILYELKGAFGRGLFEGLLHKGASIRDIQGPDNPFDIRYGLRVHAELIHSNAQ